MRKWLTIDTAPTRQEVLVAMTCEGSGKQWVTTATCEDGCWMSGDHGILYPDHWARLPGPPRKVSPEVYFRKRVKVEDRGYTSPCWIWQLSLTESGYGICTYNGRHTRSHRVAYALIVGPIPDGLHVDHLCRVRACCNPAHLEPVTCRENVQRSWRGRKPATGNSVAGGSGSQDRQRASVHSHSGAPIVSRSLHGASR